MLKRLLHFLLLPAIAGLVAGMAVLWWYQQGPRAGAPPGAPTADSYASAVAVAAPAVVNVYTTQLVSSGRSLPEDPLLNRFMERPRRERALASLGSGVIVSSEKGYILTSYHVIRHADEILVALRDGRDAPARVVGTDPGTDLALLQVALTNLPEITLNGPKPVRVGDVVLAIGNPLGVGQAVSMGIVSATGRRHLGISAFENFIQTDAAINRGNSGGALIDTSGHLIGINTAILSSTGTWQGIGFATPASIAKEVMADLIAHGRVIRGYLGLTVRSMTGDLAKKLGLKRVVGGVVTRVKPDTPAQQAGLQRGDILVGIDGKTMDSAFEALNLIAGMKPGTRVTLSLLRDGKQITVPLDVGTRPADP